MKNTKKELLLNAAEKLMSKKGYEKTTVEEITNEAGVAKGTFYVYFKSKEDVLFDLLESRVVLYKEEFEKVRDKGVNLYEKILNLTIFNIEIAKKQSNFFMIYVREIFKAEENEFSNKLKKELFKLENSGSKLMIDIFEDAIKDGEIKIKYEERLEDIVSIFNFMRNHIIRKKFFIEKKDLSVEEIEKEAKFLIDIYFNGIIEEVQ